MRRILAIVTPIAGLVALTWSQTFFTAAAVATTEGCSTIDASILGEITGIEVLSDTLTAGLGCGTGPNQIFRYVSVVTIPADVDAGQDDGGARAGEYLAGASTDCFANATFTNLCPYSPTSATVGSTYDVTVYAFSEEQWNVAALPDGGVATESSAAEAGAQEAGTQEAGAQEAGADAGSDAAVMDASFSDASDASDAGAGPSDASSGDATSTDDPSTPDGSSSVGDDAAAPPPAPLPSPDAGSIGASLSGTVTNDNARAASFNNPSTVTSCHTTGVDVTGLTSNLSAAAGWVTHCVATQQTDIPVLAQCAPLVRLR